MEEKQNVPVAWTFACIAVLHGALICAIGKGAEDEVCVQSDGVRDAMVVITGREV